MAEKEVIPDIAEKPSVIVICGPTGIGKTASAIGLSKELGGKIISADSMQVYRYMDIGTAKPSKEERIAVHHDLVDVVDPDEDFDAARFADMAGDSILEYRDEGVVPVVAGGTGLYIKSLVGGLFRMKPVDPVVMKSLENQAERIGFDAMHEKLKSVDPEAAERIHPNDHFRILRALEVFETTGNPITSYHDTHMFSDRPYRVLKIGLSMEREMLYQRINRRVDMMIEQGLVSEVETLLNMGYSAELKSMKSLGYRHITAFLSEEWSFDESVDLLKRDTRRYAKRQMTWFRADPEIKWFSPDDIEGMVFLAENFLQKKQV